MGTGRGCAGVGAERMRVMAAASAVASAERPVAHKRASRDSKADKHTMRHDG